jgi:hypothetical protein
MPSLEEIEQRLIERGVPRDRAREMAARIQRGEAPAGRGRRAVGGGVAAAVGRSGRSDSVGMKIVDLSIRRPVAVAMGFLAVVVFGVVSFGRLPLDLLPDIAFPTVTIQTSTRAWGRRRSRPSSPGPSRRPSRWSRASRR